jgi:hypothetical protein
MIDHGLGGYRQDVGMVLKKPASAGFLFSRPVLSGVVIRSGVTTLAARPAQCTYQDSH